MLATVSSIAGNEGAHGRGSVVTRSVESRAMDADDAYRESINVEAGRVQAAYMRLTGAMPNPGGQRWTGLSDSAIRARDAIGYRTGAVVWHILGVRHAAMEWNKRANAGVIATLELAGDPSFMMDAQRTITFLLDDLVFNAVSLLDYTGRLLACVIGLDEGVRHTWPKTVERARKGIYPGPVAAALIAADDEWVSGLSKFRGGMFHQDREVGSLIHELHVPQLVDQVKAELRAHLPGNLVNELRRVLPAPDGEGKVDIVDGSRAIGVRAMQTTTTVIEALTSAVRPGASPPSA